MKWFSYTLVICLRIALIVAGVAIIYSSTPQQKLEKSLRIVPVTVDEEQKVFMNFPFSIHRVLVSPYHLPAILIAMLAGLILLSPTNRKIILAVARYKSIVIASIVSFAILILTLTPAPPVIGGEHAWYAATCIMMGSVGLGLILHGIFPLLNQFGRQPRCCITVRSLWKKLYDFLFGTKPAVFLGMLSMTMFTLTNLASLFLFEHLPHTRDSIAQVFHAKIFAAGELTVSSPEHREFFDLKNDRNQSTMINNGKWYSQFPPGHSFLLMLGVLLDAAWLVNPLLGTLTIILLYFIGKELYDEKTGRIAAVLGLLSPFVVFMSSEFMNHSSTMFFFVLFVLSFAKVVHGKRLVYAFLAGIAAGMMFNIRPLTAAALIFPFGLYGGYLLTVRFREYLLPLFSLTVTVLIFIGILLSFNFLTNGDPLIFGYVALYGPEHMPGFGRAAWGDPHTPAFGLRKTLNDLTGMNKFLFEWPVPSLLFVFLLFATLTRNKWDYLLLAAFFSLVIAYFFYWFHQWLFGPRFLFEAAAALILLTARGIQRIPELLKNILPNSQIAEKLSKMTVLFLGICFLITGVGNVPALMRYYGDSFQGVDRKVLQAVEQHGLKKAIVFTRSNYGSVFTANSPFITGNVIYVRDLGEKNQVLMAAFPSYSYYLADGDDIQPLAPN